MTNLEYFRQMHPLNNADDGYIIAYTCPDNVTTCPFEDRKDIPVSTGCTHCWCQEVHP